LTLIATCRKCYFAFLSGPFVCPECGSGDLGGPYDIDLEDEDKE
jgi:hypothetical protein